MGAYSLGHGQLVPPVGRLWTADAGDGSHTYCAGCRAYPAASALAHRWVEGLYGGVAAGRGGRVSAATAWDSGPQAEAPAGGSAGPVLCPSGQGPQPSWPCRGGQPARGLRWPTPVWQAVAPAPTRYDVPDGLHGTLVWHLAWVGRAPAAPYPVSVLEPRAPPGEGLARSQPVQLCDAA